MEAELAFPRLSVAIEVGVARHDDCAAFIAGRDKAALALPAIAEGLVGKKCVRWRLDAVADAALFAEAAHACPPLAVRIVGRICVLGNCNLDA